MEERKNEGVKDCRDVGTKEQEGQGRNEGRKAARRVMEERRNDGWKDRGTEEQVSEGVKGTKEENARGGIG